MRQRVGLILVLLLCGRSAAKAQQPVILGPPRKAAFELNVAVPDRVRVGSSVAVRIQVENRSTVALGGRIRIEVSDGWQHPQGRAVEADLPSLRPGESKDFGFTLGARQVGTQAVLVRVRSDSGKEVAERVEVQVTGPALELHLSGPEHRSMGREAKFDIDVCNTGTEPGEKTCVTVTLPEGLELVSASDGGSYDAQTRQVHWSLGTLPAQQHRGLTLRLLAQGAGSWTVQATAAVDSVRGASDEATIQVDAVPALLLEVVDSIDPLAVGAETQYEVRILNRGSSVATHLQAFAAVPDGLAILDTGGPTKAAIEGQQVIFTPLPKMAPGSEAVYQIQVRAARPGDWRLKVQLFSDQLRIPLAEDENTRVYGEEAQPRKGQ